MKYNKAIEIMEAIKPLSSGKGLMVFDIDDCILSADANTIGIWKEEPGKKPIRISSEEYAKDPDAATHKEWFNYKEFRDPEKVFTSIVKGTPILRNLKVLDAHVRAGYDVAFLTARGLKDVISQALEKFLKIRDSSGNLVPVGDKLKLEVSQAVNDDNFVKIYPNLGDPAKKALVLKDVCKKYSKVKFIDDDLKNVNAVRAMNIPNLQVVHAWNKDESKNKERLGKK